MSKRVVFLITILSLVFTLSILSVISTSCGPSEPLQFVTYTDEANRFSIEYPDNWHTNTPKDPPELKVSIWEKEFGLNPVGIMVAKYAASGYTLESFFEYRKNYLVGNIENYSPVSTEELTMNGVPAIKYTYTQTVGPTAYKSVEICLVKNNTGWILAFNSPGKSFYSYKSTFNTCFNSFRILE
ncbi:MAG: hypothetical protein FJW63_04980 [Actinobacteria bacterium]|nr:hypothetical protein [Actinomycetota bacterium]